MESIDDEVEQAYQSGFRDGASAQASATGARGFVLPVRCRECAYSEPSFFCDGRAMTAYVTCTEEHIARLGLLIMPEGGYCSYGER